MTPEVTTVTEDMTVQQVIDHLRGESAEHESIYYVYVVDEERHLLGVVSLRDLARSRRPTRCVDEHREARPVHRRTSTTTRKTSPSR